MKQAVIDVGSNSVRLMLSENGRTLYKKVIVTRLSGSMQNGMLNEDAMRRTASAVRDLFSYTEKNEGITPMIFATEAVRNSVNRAVFLEYVGYPVDVIDGAEEAKIGYIGASRNRKGCNLVIDIGGASTEISVGCGNEIHYVKSVPIGVVRIFDRCGENRALTVDYIGQEIKKYGNIPHFDTAIVIGGTGLNLVAAARNIIPYDPVVVDGASMTRSQLAHLIEELEQTAPKDRTTFGIDEKRCETIVGGGRLLLSIVDALCADEVVASESDNLEGYLLIKRASE